MSMNTPRSTRDSRFQAVANALGQLIVATSKESFQKLEPRFQALEARLLAEDSSHSERLEVRRRIAEALFTEAYARNCPWPLLGRTLRRIQRLGYSNVERRYHVAALYALWCQRHPEHDSRAARRLLNEAGRSLLRLPRRHPHRVELLEQLAGLRLRTGFGAASPPATDLRGMSPARQRRGA